jgi:hypothetical protein
MKLSHISFLLATLAAAPRAIGAQQLNAPFPPPRVVPLPAPQPGAKLVHVIYDVEQDRIREVRSIPLGDLGLTGSFCFDNSELPTYYVVSNPGEELVDWGFKQCRESSLLRGITIGYGSAAVGTDEGGPGGTLNVAIYQGTEGFGVLGNEVFRRTITGLPVTGGLLGVIALLTLDFGTQPLRLTDGAIGWGCLQIDGLTGPNLVHAPRALLGTRDALDLYFPGPAPSSTYQGTFNYGGCSGTSEPCASTWIQLDEVPSNQVARTVIQNGTGVNPVLLFETQPARLGHLWAASLVAIDPGSGYQESTVLFVSRAAFGPRPSPFGEILIDHSRLLGGPQFGLGAYSYSIPADMALAGRRIFAQGAVLESSGPFLTNALSIRIGY